MQYKVVCMDRILCFLLILPQFGMGQPLNGRLARFCDSLINRSIEERLVPGVGLVIVKTDTAYHKSYGYANLVKKVPVNDSTLFQLGSVGKVFTAIAVLQQVEKGTLELTRNVNDYLREFKIENPYARPLTLQDLLTHTPGLDDRIIGYLARSESEVEPLGVHLKKFMPPLFQEPGLEINYSNYGYALAGHLVELASGEMFTEYVKRHILLPLKMDQTTYSLPDHYEQLDQYALGYRLRDSFEEVKCFPRHATPAGSALSTVTDMSKLLQEFIHPSGRILRDSSMKKLFERQFGNHPSLMGYTMGMEELFIHGYKGVSKGGSFTGFLSEFVIFPEQKFGLFISVNTQTDNFLELFRNELFNTFLPQKLSLDKQALKIDVSEFTGTFRIERYNHRSVEDLPALYQGKFELNKSDEGYLECYHNGARQKYKPVDPLIFQNTVLPEEYLVFKRDQAGTLSRLYRNINLAGFYVPVSLTRVPWYDDPVFINEYYFAVLAFIWSFIFIILFRGWVLWKRRKKPEYWRDGLVPSFYYYTAISVLFIFTVQFFGGMMFMIRNVNEFFFEVPTQFKVVQTVAYLTPVLTLLLLFACVRLWQLKRGKMIFRIYYTLLTACSMIHLAFLFRWHFIGIHT